MGKKIQYTRPGVYCQQRHGNNERESKENARGKKSNN